MSVLAVVHGLDESDEACGIRVLSGSGRRMESATMFMKTLGDEVSGQERQTTQIGWADRRCLLEEQGSWGGIVTTLKPVVQRCFQRGEPRKEFPTHPHVFVAADDAGDIFIIGENFLLERSDIACSADNAWRKWWFDRVSVKRMTQHVEVCVGGSADIMYRSERRLRHR